MLSRIAESLFWIGRYIERSDGTARILDVHLQLLLEDPWIDEDTACRSLLCVMGIEADRRRRRVAPRATCSRILAVDRMQPGVASRYSLDAARENARRAREIVSTELWEALNTDERADAAARLRPTRCTSSSTGCASAPRSPSGIVDSVDEPRRGVAVLHARPQPSSAPT